MATPTVQTGFLLAADITGYTGFLTQSELDHASEIMHELFKLLDRNLIRPIQIVKFEGDAVLCYAPGDDISDPILILDLLEQVYVAFADGLFEMKRATTCSCQACRNMGVLDLKFFLHHGQFIIENHGRGDDLAGSDVILLHRLMKNTVLEKLGLRAYLLATETALTRLGSPTGFARHREAYEHFGEVKCGVSDLGIALAEHRARREVRLTEDQALVRCSASIPVDVVTTWDYFLIQPVVSSGTAA